MQRVVLLTFVTGGSAFVVDFLIALATLRFTQAS